MATEQQNRKLSSSIVEHQERLGALSREDAQWAITNTDLAIDLFARAISNRNTGLVKDFRFVRAIEVQPAKAFVPVQRFLTDFNDGINISSIDPALHEVWGIEEDIEVHDLKIFYLFRESFNPMAIEMEIGLEANITPHDLWSLLRFEAATRGDLIPRHRHPSVVPMRSSRGMQYFVLLLWERNGWQIKKQSYKEIQKVTYIQRLIVR